jgi:hypothetical protein
VRAVLVACVGGLLGCGSSAKGMFFEAADDGGGLGEAGATGAGSAEASAADSAQLTLADGSTGLRTCSQDSDCNGSDPCVKYVCPPAGGEVRVRTCVFGAASDAGSCHDAGAPVAEAGAPVGLPPVDPQCMAGGLFLPTFPPYTPLAAPDVPATCTNGFEVGDATPGSSYAIDAKTAAGAAAIVLDVDFATYLQADGVVVTGADASGATYTLLDTCRLQTSTSGDPTGGRSRPPDQTLRQFRIQVKQGTTRLTFNFSGVVSPMYIQVLGLCDFNVTPFAAATWWQAVP